MIAHPMLRALSSLRARVAVLLFAGVLLQALGFAAAARLGMFVLFVALGLGVAAVWLLIGVVVRPLREASDLAREIARGNLERRLPVRSDDELGALAASMNTMAEALEAARRDASAEAARLRTAIEAVIAIAREARVTLEPSDVFKVVATEMRRVTGCHGVVLAVPGDARGAHVIAHLDPPSPWAAIGEGDELDREAVFRLDAVEACTRLGLDEDDSDLAVALRADGLRTALLVPLAHELGPPSLIVLAARDPDAFRSSEAEIVAGLTSHLSSALRAARLNDSLARAIAELERTRDVLVQSGMLRVAGEMASGVAHEFNNILGAVLGRAQLLRREIERGSATPEDMSRSLEIIERAAHDGSETVRRLRLFGHHGEEDAIETVALDSILRDAAEFTRPRWSNEALASGRTIAVEVASAPGLWVEARPHELREVFTNMILNAVDALLDGGTIRLAAEVRDGRAVATVTDDGIGMSDETRERVFEPFFTTKGESGAGLGMSVAYGIVQRHGGQIRVSSRAGHGTRVEVAMPLTPKRPAAIVAAEAPLVTVRATLEVLIIDDEDAVRDLIADIVRSLGHRVTERRTGAEALNDYVPGRYHLVLTDVGMPGLTGWQIADVVRALDPDVMVAFVTGWAEDLSDDALRRAAIDAVIAKPFTIEAVQRVADAAMERRVDRAA